MPALITSELRSDLASIIGHTYEVPERIRLSKAKASKALQGEEIEGPALSNEVLNTVLTPLYNASDGELVAVIEADGSGLQEPIRIDITFEEEGKNEASGYNALSPGRWCVVDNEGKGHCMYGSVRDAFLAAIRSADDPPFLSARTRRGKETPHAYVQALRAHAADHASIEEMEMYLHHYLESLAAVKAARAEAAMAKSHASRAAAELELADALSFAENFKHMKDVAAAPDRAEQLALYKKKLAARTWGDETAIERLERATGTNIAVVGPDGTVQNSTRRTQAEMQRPTIVLEHIPGASGAFVGHYVLLGREDEGKVPEYVESLASSGLQGTGQLQTLFTQNDLPDAVARAARGASRQYANDEIDDLAVALKLSLESVGGTKTRRRREKRGDKKGGRRKERRSIRLVR